MPNLLPDFAPWIRPAGRLIWFSLLTVIGLVILLGLMRRPKPDRPATWAECMAGATGTFALMTLGYAVIPHEWIQFADSYLKWDTSTFLFQSGQRMPLLPVDWPFSMDYAALRDIVVVGIYGAVIVVNVALFVLWQKRPTASELAAAREGETAEGETAQVGTSRFGRPLRRFRRA